MNTLVRAFQQETSAAASTLGDRDGASLGPLLASLYARGRDAYPKLAVSEEAFGRYLARCAGDTKTGAPLADLVIDDVYLACACAEGVRGATAAFDEKYGRVVRRAVSRVLATADERQEAEQRAWQQLLLRGTEGPARIGQYLGKGPLEKWVSVAAMRIAISFGRGESTEKRLRDKAIVEAAGLDADSLSVKSELRTAFEGAVSDALAHLKPRERLVLKLYLVSGMTLEGIGKSLGVTRQAVTKTLAHARKSVVDNVNASVRARLKLSKEDLASLLRYVASQLDVSISRVLSKR